MNYMKYIEKYNLNFQVYIDGGSNAPIFKTMDLEEEVGKLTDFIDTILTVKKTQLINNKYYYYISYKGEILGWVEDKNMFRIFQVQNNEVRLEEEVNLNNKLNSIFKIDEELLQENKMKILKSNFLVEKDGKIFTSLHLKDKLIGFSPIENAYFFIPMKQEFKFTKDRVTLYKDSKLKKPTISELNHENKLYLMLGSFENTNTARVLYKGKRYWVEIGNTDVNKLDKEPLTTSEIVIDALLHQLNDKLEKQLEFSAKKISKLETENKSFKIREDEYKEHFSKIKGLLK